MKDARGGRGAGTAHAGKQAWSAPAPGVRAPFLSARHRRIIFPMRSKAVPRFPPPGWVPHLPPRRPPFNKEPPMWHPPFPRGALKDCATRRLKPGGEARAGGVPPAPQGALALQHDAQYGLASLDGCAVRLLFKGMGRVTARARATARPNDTAGSAVRRW